MTVKNVEKLEKSRVAVTVEVGAEEFEAAVAKAYAKARGKLSIPGFLPGNAPRKMIEKLYGAGVFYSDAVDIVLPEAYTQAIGQSGLDVVGYPEIEIVDDKIDENGFTFKATVAVYPEVKLGEYKGLTAEKEEIKVSADDVKERLNEMAERNARLVSVDRKAKKGDIAVIDFEGFDNGEAFEGGKGENYELELGSGSFVPGFEDQVIGMKAGEEKDLDITFPEDYHKDLAGKKVVFHVKAKEIKCKELPKLDDDFAKDVSEYDTLKELKDSIKREITEQREQAAKFAIESSLMEKVAEGIECDIPDAMIEEQCRRFLDEFKQRLQAQGIPYDQYCKMTGMNEEKFMEDGKEPAMRQVRMDLAVNAIIKEENLDATDEEVEKQYTDLAEKYSMDVGELKKYLDEMSVRAQLIRALLAQRDGGGGGGGGEGEDHRGRGLLEEAEGADARRHLGGEGIAEDCVDDVAEVGAAQHHRKRAEDLRALRGDDPGHHRKYADGTQRDDESHHALNDRIERGDQVLGKLALLARGKDAAAEHQRDNDDLQHVRVGERLPHVAREDGDQRIHEVRARRAVPGLTVRQGKVRREEAGVQEDVGKHQADDAGAGRGDEEVGDRLPADGADLLHVAHRDDAVDHRQQHDGHDDELEEVDEDGAEGL